MISLNICVNIQKVLKIFFYIHLSCCKRVTINKNPSIDRTWTIVVSFSMKYLVDGKRLFTHVNSLVAPILTHKTISKYPVVKMAAKRIQEYFSKVSTFHVNEVYGLHLKTSRFYSPKWIWQKDDKKSWSKLFISYFWSHSKGKPWGKRLESLQ